MCKCKYFHLVTATVTATEITLVPTNPVTIADRTRFCFKVVSDIPATADALPVLITLNGVATNVVWNKYGNPATGAEVREGRLYKAWYGATVPHVIVDRMPVSKECV